MNTDELQDAVMDRDLKLKALNEYGWSLEKLSTEEGIRLSDEYIAASNRAYELLSHQ